MDDPINQNIQPSASAGQGFSGAGQNPAAFGSGQGPMQAQNTGSSQANQVPMPPIHEQTIGQPTGSVNNLLGELGTAPTSVPSAQGEIKEVSPHEQILGALKRIEEKLTLIAAKVGA